MLKVPPSYMKRGLFLRNYCSIDPSLKGIFLLLLSIEDGNNAILMTIRPWACELANDGGLRICFDFLPIMYAYSVARVQMRSHKSMGLLTPCHHDNERLRERLTGAPYMRTRKVRHEVCKFFPILQSYPKHFTS